MSGIHPRLKRPVGHRLAVAAVSLLHGGKPLTGPTIAGCVVAAKSSTLTLKFNLSLLGDDSVQVQPFVNADGTDANNMSTWTGVDSLTAMVCGSAPTAPAPPKGMSCQQKCEAGAWRISALGSASALDTPPHSLTRVP